MLQGGLSSAISSMGNLGLMLYGGLLVINESMTLGTLMAFTTLSGYFINPISRLVSMQLSIQGAGISLMRLSEIYSVKEETEEQDGKAPFDETIEDIELSDVVFRYGSRPPVLKGVSIHIGKGEKVALVGRSGCGKTSLSKLILKFYSPTSGTVKINGRDLNEID